MGISNRMLASLLYLGLGTAAMAHPEMRIDASWHGISPRQCVIINGSMAKGQFKVWSTYQNGVFYRDNRSEESFRVPRGVNLMIVQADLTFEDTRKYINVEFNLKQENAMFALAKATFSNPDGCPSYTATKNFMTGLVIPQNGILNISDKELPNSTYGVTLYGFYFR